MSIKKRPLVLVTACLAGAALLSVACESTEGGGDNRGMKRGAAGGALLGLTMGALTGDAGLAMKGAVAGGVAGGVAGSMSDLESDRDSERTAIMADAIVGRGGGTPVPESTRPQTWERLDVFPGVWSCSIWGFDESGDRVTASSTWTGSLTSTSSARLTLDAIDLQGYDDGVDAEFGGGYSQLSYNPDTGYELLNAFTLTEGSQRWVGERMSGEERYSFYFVGSEPGTRRRRCRRCASSSASWAAT